MGSELEKAGQAPLLVSVMAEGGDGVKRKGRSSTTKAFGNICVSIVGSGVLGLPYTFRVSGWAVASSTIILAASLTYYCMILLVQCRIKVEHEGLLGEGSGQCTYGDLGQISYGEVGKRVVDTMVVVSQCGCCVAYLIFIGQNLSSVFYGDTSEQALLILACIPFQVVLAWGVRTLSGLAPFSLFANACNVLAMAAVVRADLMGLGQGGGGVRAFGKWADIPFAMGVSIYCYEGFGMTLSIEASMERPAKFGRVLAAAIYVITVAHLAFGFLGYAAFGDATQDIVTLNLPGRAWSTAVVKIGICIALFFTFPVMMHPVYEIVEDTFLSSRPRQFPLLVPNVLRTVLILAASSAAIFIPAFGLFISFVGSTISVTLAFVLPALFHLNICGDSINIFWRAVDVFLVIAGIAFTFYGAFNALVHIFSQP